MQSTGGIADRFEPLAERLERPPPGGLPLGVRFWDDSELRPAPRAAHSSAALAFNSFGPWLGLEEQVLRR